MKKIIFSLSLFAAAIFLFENNANAQTNNSSAILRHIVIITFKQDAPADSIQALQNPIIQNVGRRA